MRRAAATTDIPGAIGVLGVMVATLALGWAVVSQSMGGLIVAVAIAHLMLLLSSSGPGIGIMLLTTGRFIYFIALLVFLHLEGDSAYTALYFFIVDLLIFVNLLRNREKGTFRIAGSKVFFVSLTLFAISTLASWIYSGYSSYGLYWLGTFVVFALLPLCATLVLTPKQVFSACRWMFWSVAMLASVFAFEVVTGQVAWFSGRASLVISNVPQIGSLFIGSVIPIGLFAIAFLGRELFSTIGLRLNSASILVRWGGVVLFGAMLLFTGQRTPLVALIASGLCLLMLPRIGVKPRLGILVGAVALLVSVSLIPNSDRYFVLSRVAQGEPGALSADETASMRLEYYRISFDSFVSSPVLGNGLGSFYDISSRSTGFPDRIPHNAFLEIAAGQGLLGALPMGILIVATAWTALGDLRRFSSASDRGFRLLAFITISWLYEIALVAMTSSVFADSIFWFFVGAIWVLHSPRSATVEGLAGSAVRFKKGFPTANGWSIA